ncbi:MAG TPA: hypothetical protein VMU10_06025, partial [Desulfomonilia bacterium]|nr:hypothetical protein [Desulfomonilia bacterium]
PGSIIFSIDDGTNPVYTVNLANTNVVRVVKLSDENDTGVKSLWAVYDRSRETTIGLFPYGARVTFTVAAMNRQGNQMKEQTYSFAVETRDQHDSAASTSPVTAALKPGDPVLTGGYDSGIEVLSGLLAGAVVIFNSEEPVKPEFGPSGEISALDENGVYAVGLVLNLQPPTIFNTPVKVVIPCAGYTDLSQVSVYFSDGASWVLACDGQGNVQEAALGWMVEGSRVDHPDYSPPSIEIKLNHFSAIQAGSSSKPATVVPKSGGGDGGGGGCFIGTALL